MGTIGRLFRRIAGQRDRPGKASCHAAFISPSWLQSIGSLSKSGELSGGTVIVPVPPLSPSILTSIRFRTDQSGNDRSRDGRPLPTLSSVISAHRHSEVECDRIYR
jgi:hypothetical protein